MYKKEVDKIFNKLDKHLEDLGTSVQELIPFQDNEYFYDHKAEYDVKMMHIRKCENMIISILNNYLGLKESWYTRFKFRNRPVTIIADPFPFCYYISVPVDVNEFKYSVVHDALRRSKWIEGRVTRKPHYTRFHIDCFGGEL